VPTDRPRTYGVGFCGLYIVKLTVADDTHVCVLHIRIQTNRNTQSGSMAAPSAFISATELLHRRRERQRDIRDSERVESYVVSMKTKLSPRAVERSAADELQCRRALSARVPSCMEAMGLLDLARRKWASDALLAAVCRNRVTGSEDENVLVAGGYIVIISSSSPSAAQSPRCCSPAQRFPRRLYIFSLSSLAVTVGDC